MKILADRNMAGVRELFAGLGEVELFDGRRLDSAAGADVLLVRSVTRVDERLLGDHRPRFVGSATSGFDHVDRELLTRLGIPFAHAPGSNADSVVDYVLSALCHTGRLPAVLAGAPLGIIGYGHIGRRLHTRLERLGVQCRAHDPWLSAEDYPLLTSLDAVLDCPVVTLHASLTRAEPWPSYHMLAPPALSAMPEGGLLINAGRGELIESAQLIALLERRPDLDLVLDVWEGEPRVDAALLDACRFGTAHIAGYSHDGKLRATEMLYREACRVLAREAGALSARTGEAVVVEAPSLASAELLCWLVQVVYDIREDDRLLRGAPDNFDALRKGYRQRRELACLAISNGAALDEEARALCTALGCEVMTC